MPAIENTVINRIKTVISSDYSAGFSGYDLSGAGSVVVGDLLSPPVVPCASIIYIDTIESQGRSLGRYSGTIRYQISAFTGGSNVQERIENALNLAADISKSLTSDRSMGLVGTIEDLLVNRTALNGEEYQLEGLGIALLEVQVTFSNQFGV
tara:strand:- start:974 stop:1429 length:456 start_codon:yes stop_codon:yes gene_type:complete